MRIFAEVPRGEASNDSGVDNGNFQRFHWLFLGYFRDVASNPSIIYSDMQSVVVFSWSQNAWLWITLNGYLALNSVFASVWLAETMWHILWKSSAGTLHSGNIRFVRIFTSDLIFFNFGALTNFLHYITYSLGFSRKKTLKDSEVTR